MTQAGREDNVQIRPVRKPFREFPLQKIRDTVRNSFTVNKGGTAIFSPFAYNICKGRIFFLSIEKLRYLRMKLLKVAMLQRMRYINMFR